MHPVVCLECNILKSIIFVQEAFILVPPLLPVTTLTPCCHFLTLLHIKSNDSVNVKNVVNGREYSLKGKILHIRRLKMLQCGLQKITEVLNGS